MARSPEWQQGRRSGVKWAVTFLYDRADEMNDEHARAILNSAAQAMGRIGKYDETGTEPHRTPNVGSKEAEDGR